MDIKELPLPLTILATENEHGDLYRSLTKDQQKKILKLMGTLAGDINRNYKRIQK